jgi:hypothetical protein
MDMELVYTDAPFLFDSMLQSSQGGAAVPDVIFASTSAAEPLRESDLLSDASATRGFFLEGLLAAYPELAVDLCGDTPLADCLWPGTASNLPLVEPQARAVSLATSTLCEASPWLPFCSGSALLMTPLGWDFDIYLIDGQWLAENGMDEPVSVDEVLDLRSSYAIRFTAARPNAIPTVDEAGHPPVFKLSSTLLDEHAGEVLQSLSTFHAAQYVPVVSLNVYGAYISADAAHPALAQEFIAGLAADPDAKAFMTRASGRLPALTPQQLTSFAADDDLSIYTMRSLALLTTYAAMAY